MYRRYGNLNYAQLTKRSFLLGVGLFILGEFGEIGLNMAGAAVPPWEHSLLTILAATGILVALLSPFVFGIILPLTE